MTISSFEQQLNERIAQYDLLCHPFYRAWTAGELTREDLRLYATEYFHQVSAFPGYLSTFAARLENGPMRRAVLANLADEEGQETQNGGGRPHTELWLDFAEGMGADRDAARRPGSGEALSGLTAHFQEVAAAGTPEAALAAFYAYESQVPRVAQEKARGLRKLYSGDDATCGYFDLHATADIYHANVWRELLSKQVASDPQKAETALAAAEDAARALWSALDGIEADRMARAA